MREIKPGIVIEDNLAGVTLGAIIQPQGVLMVDAPLRIEDARSWKAFLTHQAVGNFRYLVNLDAHHDRVLGNRAMGSPVIAHYAAAKAFEDRGNIFKGQLGDSGSEWENYLEVIGTRWLAPSITYTKAMAIHWGGPTIYLEHHPGPSNGATWVHIPEEKIVFIGDAVTLNQPPFLGQADIPQWLDSLKLLLKVQYRGYTFISGRGGIVNLEDIRFQREWLKYVHRRLEAMAKRNAPPENTERIVPRAIKQLEFPAKLEEFYAERLRYGLLKYYIRHYKHTQTEPPTSNVE